MAAQKDTDRTAATAAAIDGTALWVIVNNVGASVKMTLAQLKTNYNAVTSMTGNVTASIAAGVATTTIGASSVATAMIQDLAVSTAKIAADAVTYAKIQDMTTSRLLGRTSASTGIVEELSVSADLTLTGGTLGLAFSPGTPTVLGSDFSTGTTSTLADVGIALAVSANTDYFFEYFLWWTCSDDGDGPKFAVTCPSSPTSITYTIEIWNDVASTNGTTYYYGTGDVSDEAVTVSTTTSGTLRHPARVFGILRNGANAGNLQMRAADVGGTGTISVKRGSFGRKTTL